MAVVSDDHADESYNVENHFPSIGISSSSAKPQVLWFSQEEVNRHNQESIHGDDISSFWACIDGFVVEAIDFLNGHPGGKRKLLATNDPSTGDTGHPFAFSFSRGRNAHFPGTAKTFKEGIEKFLDGESTEIVFPGEYKKERGAKLVVLGRLKR